MTCRMAAGQQKKHLRSSNIYEKYSGKKKRKVDSSEYFLNLKSHINLQWDGSQKSVLSKMNQIGITWEDISPFIDPITQPHSGVADIISVPHDMFSLDDLTEVLSYKVWSNCLSEADKNLLTQFLPIGTDVEQVVHSLLSGNNHHFGNPLLKWSSSVCSGQFHPDVLLQTERNMKMKKKTYYRNLNKYHTGMLGLLTKWTQKWLSCKDPEKLHSGAFFKKEESTSAGEKAKISTPIKREMLQNICNRKSDTDKYLSYIKVSKRQHAMVKNMRHSGDGIPAKSLAQVIGDVKTFHIHPYEKFEEEEKKLLHDHWLQVVKEDIPAAYELSSERKLQKKQWTRLLEEELMEEPKLMMSLEIERSQNCESSAQESSYGTSENQHVTDAEGGTGADSADIKVEIDANFEISADHNELDDNASHDTHSELVVGEGKTQDVVPANDMLDLSYSSMDKSKNQNTFQPEVSTPLAKEIWQSANLQDCYYHNAGSNSYLSASESSLRQTQLNKPANDIIDLQRDASIKAEGLTQLPFQRDNGALPFFVNQEQMEGLPTFPKAAPLSSYQYEHISGTKQPAVQLLMNNVSLPGSEFQNHQLVEQQQLGQADARGRGIYMHPIMNTNLHTANSYSNQGHFPTIEQGGFAAVQPSINGGYNWFPVDNQPYNNCYGVESSVGGPSMSNCTGNADGSLYSVLSKKLSTASSYEVMSSEQYIQGRNFIGGVMPSQNIYSYGQQQIQTPSFQDTTVMPPMSNALWMNFPCQNPSLDNSVGRSHIRPWNR